MVKKSVIITSGGMSEPIDSVRSITNFSTGALGSIIAEQFVKSGEHVVYIHSKFAKLPNITDDSSVKFIEVNCASELLEVVSNLFNDQSDDYYAFIHAMAVSDYEVDYIDPPLVNGKLSSDIPNPTIHLKQTPKVIAKIKELAPSIKLVGFKLLAGVSVQELIDVALNLGQKNHCDLVVANRREDISSDGSQEHTAYVCKIKSIDSAPIICHTKGEIATTLRQQVHRPSTCRRP
jgi:phosphopantothenate-cysteine ligase